MIYAGFWRRYAASLLDAFFVLVGYTVLLKLALSFYGVDSNELSAETRQLLEIGSQSVYGFLYHWLMLYWRGATLGKSTVGIRVVDLKTSGELGLGQAALRTFGTYVSLLLLAAGYLMMLFDSQKRTLHDRMAGTGVIRQPR